MNRIYSILLGSTVLVACQKFDTSKNPNANSEFVGDVEVSDDFSWSTTNELSTEVTYSVAQKSMSGKVEVLDRNFNPIVAWNKTAGESNKMVKALIADFNDTLYLYSRDLRINEPFLPSASIIDLSLNQKSTHSPIKGNVNFKAAENCASKDCDQVISDNRSNLSVPKDKTYCVTGNVSGNITLEKDADITICGNATISNINANGGKHKIIISASGSLTMNNLNINKDVELINYGVLNVSSGINLNDKLENFGTINASGLNVNNDGKFENEGTINLSGSTNINNDFKNEGTVTASGNFAINNNAKVENKCKIKISGDLNVNGELKNEAYISVTGRTTFNNSGKKAELKDGSIIVTRDLTINSNKLESNGTGVVKVSDRTTINGGAKVDKGFVDICDENGIETNNSGNNGNFLFCETNVATSDCVEQGLNISGSGSGGGAQPFEVSYPSSGSAYRAFEDLWPSRGDYDFNDLLLQYNLTYKANANNKLEEIILNLKVKSIGGSLKNGIALQLLKADLNRYNGQIFTSVTGGKTASLKSNNSTVVISNAIVDELPSYYSNTGTGPSNNNLHEIVLNIAVNPASGIEVTDLVADLFIFRTAQPGLEIHMPGNPPSPAADMALFNTFEDKSLTKGFYKTSDNFPWAIEVAGSNIFAQPREKINVSEAYPEFATWVGSQGTSNKEWYKKPIVEKIF